MIKLVILLASFSGPSSDTNHFKNDFAKVKLAMSYESYSANIQYRVYLDKKLAETSVSTVKMDGEQYLLNFGQVTKVNNKDYNLLIDDVNKVVVVSKAEKNLKAMSKLPSIDSFINKAERVIESIIDSTTKRYTIELKDCKEKFVEIDLNTKTYQIKRIYVIMTEPHIDGKNNPHEKAVEISYVKFQEEVDMPSSIFSIDAYVKIKSKIISNSVKTKDFTIVDLLNEKDNKQ
jgi:hypothetical protein